MATRRDPRFKECRRFGVNVYGHPKALKRVRKDQRQKKMSEYGTQLLEKQKLRAYYNLLERQFVRYYDKAKKMEGVTGQNMLKLLECRLDNLVYRIGPSARHVRWSTTATSWSMANAATSRRHTLKLVPLSL